MDETVRVVLQQLADEVSRETGLPDVVVKLDAPDATPEYLGDVMAAGLGVAITGRRITLRPLENGK